jgi:acyl-CoA reductase-like NAD-dependent aldehyde dehydrogenase
MRRLTLFINGAEVAASGREIIEVRNPSTNEVIAHEAEATAADVDRAVSAARTAFVAGWGQSSFQARSDILRALAAEVRSSAARLVEMEVAEVGRPVGEVSVVDVPETAECFEYFAAAARAFRGSSIPMSGPYTDFTVTDPVGVIAQLVPWNFPLNLASWKIAPALAMGNCIVLKPSELTPSSVLMLAQLATKAGLPSGVLNIVTGRAHPTGRALVEHPDVDMVAYTGGGSSGREIAAEASRLGKRFALELGGKSAQIVFADADLKAAALNALEGAFFAVGQNCCAGSRVLVHESIKADFVNAITSLASKLRIGKPDSEDTQIGCLISPAHHSRVQAYVDAARQEGAIVHAPSLPAHLKDGQAGCFMSPTVVVDPDPGSSVVREEVFGPVLTVNSFRTEDDAVQQANGTNYDLAAGIWTNDVGRAHRLALRLRAGSVWINTFNRVFNSAPFGGYRWSGYGRDLGLEALAQYGAVKNICIAHNPGADSWFSVE